MKKFILKPGFEAIFALSLIVILGLPPVLLAQNEKEVDIRINKGDTIVNGKNIKDITKEERAEALKDIKHLGRPLTAYRDSMRMMGKKHLFMRKRFDTLNNSQFGPERRVDMQGQMETMFKERERRIDENEHDGGNFNGGFRMHPKMNRKNVQYFDYENIDNNGISTHVRFRVSEISNEDLKRIPHVEGGRFEIENLNIVPEFNSGSTLLMFNLIEKTEAAVKLIDSEGKILWEEKVGGGRFSKTFVLGLNGIYFLQIKQGNFFAVKRIVKEE